MKISILHPTESNRDAYLALDYHITPEIFERKLRDDALLLLKACDEAVGVLRWSYFWDTIPFCDLVLLREDFRGRGLGRELVRHWEQELRERGFERVLTSTQIDESGQHFWRKLGYRDCGVLILDSEPGELFLTKRL